MCNNQEFLLFFCIWASLCHSRLSPEKRRRDCASNFLGGEAAVTLYEYLSMNIQILSWQACVINSDGSPAVYTAHSGSTELCFYNYSTQVSKATKDYDRAFHCRFQNYFTRRTHCTPRDHIHVLQSTKFHNVIT